MGRFSDLLTSAWSNCRIPQAKLDEATLAMWTRAGGFGWCSTISSVGGTGRLGAEMRPYLNYWGRESLRLLPKTGACGSHETSVSGSSRVGVSASGRLWEKVSKT